jgi:hypothetical protein
VEFLLRFIDVLHDFLGAVFNVLDHFVLFRHQLLHLVEQLSQLNDRLFDALDLVVTSLDLSERRSGLTTAVSGQKLQSIIST